MILYTVYQNDWECPEQIFHTMNKEKAEQFVNLNNQYITDNMDKFFIDSIDLDTVEQKADEILSKHGIRRKTLIDIENNKQALVGSYIKYLNIEENENFAEIFDYCDGKWNKAIVTLITDINTIPDLRDLKVQNEINKLINEEIKFQNELLERDIEVQDEIDELMDEEIKFHNELLENE